MQGTTSARESKAGISPSPSSGPARWRQRLIACFKFISRGGAVLRYLTYLNAPGRVEPAGTIRGVHRYTVCMWRGCRRHERLRPRYVRVGGCVWVVSSDRSCGVRGYEMQSRSAVKLAGLATRDSITAVDRHIGGDHGWDQAAGGVGPQDMVRTAWRPKPVTASILLLPPTRHVVPMRSNIHTCAAHAVDGLFETSAPTVPVALKLM
jgi:hypothetical protein